MRAVPRHFRVILLIGLALAAYVVTCTAQSQRQRRPQRSIVRAAEALGGRDRILAIKTLTIEGYGQLAYQNGGGNITSSHRRAAEVDRRQRLRAGRSISSTAARACGSVR